LGATQKPNQRPTPARERHYPLERKAGPDFFYKNAVKITRVFFTRKKPTKTDGVHSWHNITANCLVLVETNTKHDDI